MVFPPLYFLSESEVLFPFPGNSKPQKNSLAASQNSLSVFNLAEKEFFGVWNSLEMGTKPHFPTKNKVAEIPSITVEFIANKL